MKSLQLRKVVLFDHDGTVVDSEIIALQSAWRLTQEVATQFPGARFYTLSEFIKSFAGKPYREILGQVYLDSPNTLNEADITRLVIEEENRAIEYLSKEAKATPGTPSVLTELGDRGSEFALVSNSSRQRLNACLAASGLNQYFPGDRIFSAENSLPVWRPKPLPDIYLYAIEHLGVNVLDCVAVEDSLSGVRSAVAAGIPQVIGYVGGTHINADERDQRVALLRSASAHHVIEKMPDLMPLLLGEPVVYH